MSTGMTSSESGNIQSTERSTSPPDKYLIWFRHTGQPPIEGTNWVNNPVKEYTAEEIKKGVSVHTITHLILEGDVPVNIAELSPHVTDIRVRNIRNKNSLDNLSQLTNLQKLYIGGNSLYTVPDVVCSLTSLTELNMSICELSALPESLCQLTNLQKLDIQYNYLHTVPDVVCSLTSLTELYMSECGLSTLPESLCQLTNLQKLDIQSNSLHTVPDVVCSLTSLTELNMSRCRLSTLPKSLSALSNLQSLVISSNSLTHLPDHISQLKNLSHLRISGNKQLKTLTSEILNMPLLSRIYTYECNSLTSPPIEVCMQGVAAIRVYYTDLLQSDSVDVSIATVAVIGQTCSGKTSLIKTLQSTEGVRVLTNRDENAESDETTRVFKMEEVMVENDTLQFIDFGGNSIYQSTYQFTLKQNCIPIVVISMGMYSNLFDEVGGNEAVRQLYFNWLSHLYLAYPDLGPSKLVFTYQDKFKDTDEFAELEGSFMHHTRSVFEQIRLTESAKWKDEGKFARIEHFEHAEMFNGMDIYRIGKTYSNTFNQLKESLLVESKKVVKRIPKPWKKVDEALKSLEDGYRSFDEIHQMLTVELAITRVQLEVILTYLHNSGKLLWYKDHEELRSYIFYRIPVVTTLLEVLFTHDDTVWQRRLSTVSNPSPDDSHLLSKEEFTRLADQFQSTGTMHSTLLHHLLRTETLFTMGSSTKVAVDILKSFRLLYVPKGSDSNHYIMPYFCKEFLDSPPTSEDMPISLHTDLQFEGLPLPQTVFHQVTVEMLNSLSVSKEAVVRNNGARVSYDGQVVQLSHDYRSGRVSVNIVTSVKRVPEAWQRLVDITNKSIKYVEEGWKATRMKCTFFCPHCLLKDHPHPERKVNPSWCQFHGRKPPRDHPDTRTAKVWTCKKDPKAPACLTTPCYSLSDEELKSLENYVSVTRTPRPSVSTERLVPPPQTQHTDDGDSDISDVEDFPPTNIHMHREPVLTTKSRIKQMFDDQQVYKMSETMRGRALIINNRFFVGTSRGRAGSDIDVENMFYMLRKLHFDVEVKHGLPGEEILPAIKRETEHREQRDFGMHVTVIMSHGAEQGVVYGTDRVKVKLTDVYHLLSSNKFVSMAGKPKVIIVQACSAASDESAAGVEKTTPQSTSAPETNQSDPRPESRRSGFSVDDLLIITSCFEGNSAMRHPRFGSPFIRVLVKTLYKHACHRDLYTLFDIVQHRVNTLSKQLVERDPTYHMEQTPVVIKTLTGYRKIYLFPGFRIRENYDGDESEPETDTETDTEVVTEVDAEVDTEVA